MALEFFCSALGASYCVRMYQSVMFVTGQIGIIDY